MWWVLRSNGLLWIRVRNTVGASGRLPVRVGHGPRVIGHREESETSGPGAPTTLRRHSVRCARHHEPSMMTALGMSAASIPRASSHSSATEVHHGSVFEWVIGHQVSLPSGRRDRAHMYQPTIQTARLGPNRPGTEKPHPQASWSTSLPTTGDPAPPPRFESQRIDTADHCHTPPTGLVKVIRPLSTLPLRLSLAPGFQ